MQSINDEIKELSYRDFEVKSPTEENAHDYIDAIRIGMANYFQYPEEWIYLQKADINSSSHTIFTTFCFDFSKCKKLFNGTKTINPSIELKIHSADNSISFENKKHTKAIELFDHIYESLSHYQC